jgi:hypothetical protein
MIEEKREMIIRELNDIPENVLDNILALIEESKKPEKKDSESALDVFVKSGILIPPIGPPKAEAKHIAIKGKGKPLSEMIIEDRR